MKGKKTGSLEVTISGKPDFHDCVYLAKHSPQNSPYQYIPFGINTQISIDFMVVDAHLTIREQQHSLILQGCSLLTEEKAFDIFKTFAIKDGNKVAYLTNCPAERQEKKREKAMSAKAEKNRGDGSSGTNEC